MTGQRWIVLLTALALLLAPHGARADSIAVQENNIEFDRSYTRTDAELPAYISLRDCEDDVTISFPVNIDAATRELVVWVGPRACSTPDDRDRSDCVEALAQEVNSQTTVVEIKTQKLLEGKLAGKSCAEAQSRDDAEQITLMFALTDSTGEPSDANGERVTLNMWHDLRGPDGPTITKATPGEGKIVVYWDPLEVTSLTGYELYCAEEGSTPDMDAGLGQGGQQGTSECTSALVPSAVPTGELCGEVAGQTATKGNAKHLANNTTYAVGVAAVDAVGNRGVLSSVLCATPQEVTDFYEAYVAAGGKGGGGYCAFGMKRPGSLAALALLALFGYSVRRRLRS